MTLLDPEKKSGYDCAAIAKDAEAGGTTAIMVGGSTVASGVEMEDAVKRIKAAVKLPVIIFPNNIASITGAADAIWFMSLLNSANTYYLIDSQAIGAPMVKKLGIESMPMGYIIVGYGGAAGYVGQARVVPYDRPELAVAYASAAELLGMRYIYLEAGSGAPTASVPTDDSGRAQVLQGHAHRRRRHTRRQGRRNGEDGGRPDNRHRYPRRGGEQGHRAHLGDHPGPQGLSLLSRRRTLPSRFEPAPHDPRVQGVLRRARGEAGQALRDRGEARARRDSTPPRRSRPRSRVTSLSASRRCSAHPASRPG